MGGSSFTMYVIHSSYSKSSGSGPKSPGSILNNQDSHAECRERRPWPVSHVSTLSIPPGRDDRWSRSGVTRRTTVGGRSPKRDPLFVSTKIFDSDYEDDTPRSGG